MSDPDNYDPFAKVVVSGWSCTNLEFLERCPICMSTDLGAFLDNLTDYNCHTVPGLWRLCRCQGCGVAVLNPRLNAQAINRAYADYPTHNSWSERPPGSWPTRVARMLRMGYLAQRYGLASTDTKLPGWLAYLLPPMLRWEWDYLMRNMPRPAPGRNRLLDVGCGNGDFMALARMAGWEPLGLDFDPEACQTAAKQGLEVRCGGQEVLDNEERFDFVTLGHVIEHVHDPVDMMRRVWRYVSPGGILWSSSPNIAGPGFAKFHRSWVHLETPRHLFLFDKNSLLKCFYKAALPSPQFLRRGWNLAPSFAQSKNIAERGDRLNGWRLQLRGKLLMSAIWAEVLALLGFGAEDELVIRVQKPISDTGR